MDSEQAFVSAVKTRDRDAVRSVLAKAGDAGALVNAPLFSFDSPALLAAASSGDLGLIEVLLEFGADPNARSEWWAGGFHVLHSARGAVADRLIEAGAVPDACAAANLDRMDLLVEILDQDATRVRERGGDGQTPLHFAQSRPIIDVLLERGAEIDARDIDHRATAAEWMLAGKRGEGRYALAEYLADRGAALDIFLATALGRSHELRAMLEADRSLLQLRTGQGEYGEQPPSSYHIYTWSIGQNLSPMQVASQFGQPEALAVLSEFANTKDRFLHACEQADKKEAKQLLAENSALLHDLTPDDHRALADAGWGDNAAGVQLMLELGFDATVIGHFGGTVLHGAAWEGSVACTEVILQHPAARAILDEPDPNYGGAPLHWCCHGSVNCGNPEADHAAVARLLLEAGAQLDDKVEGCSPDVMAVIRDYRGRS